MLVDRINVMEWFRAKSPSLARCKEGDLPLLNISNLTCMDLDDSPLDFDLPRLPTLFFPAIGFYFKFLVAELTQIVSLHFDSHYYFTSSVDPTESQN